ncbi:MAG: ABC transporter ATP-binding protein [Acidimicrobiales bacterium]
MSRGRETKVLEVSNLEKSFGDLRAVDGVSFTIEPGETYGLLGPNGAGKTTAISMIAGLLRSDGGEVQVLGQVMTPTSRQPKASVGLVPQDLAIYPDLTARENLAFFGRLYSMQGDQLRERVDEVLEVIGLEDRANDRSEEFSGGMKRRLNIGIGLLHRPQLLILDEPTVGVDPQSRNSILESVESLSADGLAVLYTTHYMEEAERLCDRVAIVDKGRVQAEGTRRELVTLVGENDRIRIQAAGATSVATEHLERLPGVVTALASGSVIELIVEDASSILAETLRVITDAGTSVSSVSVEEPDLEAVFLHLTGKALRD